jgi:site-specific recombinase XerD
MFMLMLRCGLWVEEVANLTIAALDLSRCQVFVYNGKDGKNRIVYTRVSILKGQRVYYKAMTMV